MTSKLVFRAWPTVLPLQSNREHQTSWTLESSGGCMATKEKKEEALFWEMVLHLCPKWQA